MSDYDGEERRGKCDNHERIGDLLDFKARSEPKIKANCIELKSMKEKGEERRAVCATKITKLANMQSKFIGGLVVASLFVSGLVSITYSTAKEAEADSHQAQTDVQLIQKDVQQIQASIKRIEATHNQGMLRQEALFQQIMDKLK